MLKAQDVERILLADGIPVSGSAVRDSVADGRYYVFVEVKRNARGRQEPANAKLHSMKASLQEKGVLVDFILTDGARRDAEAGLRATLLHSFGGAVRNSFLSSEVRNAFVWVVPKRQLTDDELDSIGQKAKVFLDEIGLELVHVTTTTGENLPSKTRCMTMLRQVAPATSAQLAVALREAGLVVPSDDWMTRRLDALRKAGLVVRTKAGCYALTLPALKRLGTVKGQASPDVSRLLALAWRHG